MHGRNPNETPSTDISRTIEQLPVASLISNPRNSRTHSKKQLRKLSESIQAFGFLIPILIDGANVIVAGNGRLAAARALGMTTVPTVRITHLSPAQQRAYVIADNKIAEQAGWDRELLAVEFRELQTALPEIGLTLEITGFDMGEIDPIILDLGAAEDNALDDIPKLVGQAVSKAGDIFILGAHRLIVGDAREKKRAATDTCVYPAGIVILGHRLHIQSVVEISVSKNDRGRMFAWLDCRTLHIKNRK